MPARAATDGRLIADGGSVLGVTALGRDLAAARERAYAQSIRIDWPKGFAAVISAGGRLHRTPHPSLTAGKISHPTLKNLFSSSKNTIYINFL